MSTARQNLFEEYLQVVQRLRKECPWDREQTHESIRHSLIEEAYEVVEAIDRGNPEELKQELGDLLLHVTLHSIMSHEEKTFAIEDVLKAGLEKLVRRHPHIFGDLKVHDAGEVKANWEKIKMSEGRRSVLEGVPKELPALLQAQRLQEKASKVGFDWNKKSDVWEKVDEEMAEFQKAEESGNGKRMEEEFGDLLFSLVNYARFVHMNPELALRQTNQKFSKRFRHIETELSRRGKKPGEATLEEMDALWNEGKAR